MKRTIIIMCGGLVLGMFGILLQDDELVEKGFTACRNRFGIQHGEGTASDAMRGMHDEKEAVGLSVLRACLDPRYDRPDSLLATLLKSPTSSFSAAAKTSAIQFPRAPVGNGERGRLCNFMVQTLYESRPTNTNYYDGIRMVLLGNDHPEVYSAQTREIVKKLVLGGELHFSYSAIVGITTDRDIRNYLTAVMHGTERNQRRTFSESWMATCMLAKDGEKEARKKAADRADGLTDLTDLPRAADVTLGLAYICDKEMVLHLFKMLKSDLKKWNGEDVMPKETQLAHEAAAALSLCVKDFPKYNPFLSFTGKDKAKCLKWVEDHQGTFLLENKPPLYYLKNTWFDFLTH